MRISMNWLSDFVEWIETDPQIIADRLTAGTGEVDDAVAQGALLGHCVVGKVTNLRKHPGADKLSLCDVVTEAGTKPLVCGGTNLKEGMLVALAHVGATVRHGSDMVTLKAATIRGEKSEGMICAAEELELAGMFPPLPEHGARPVIDLTPLNLNVGTPLREALGLNDVVFHIDNHAITNRPDLFSHIGVAREVVAHGLAKWKKRPTTPAVKFAKAKPTFGVHDKTDGCVPFYNACVLEIDGPGVTPDWMKARLEATGFRSISLPIDITNYVMLEQGMPLHTFDAGDFKGDIHVRLSKKGETMTTLDKAKRTLPDGVIVISDDEGIFDLFGIMGGLRTSTTENTKRIFLQAAIPDPVTIRKATIALAHRTDAATVYEKGVQPCTSEAGLARAVQLFCELCPGGRVTSSNVRWGKEKAAATIAIKEARISALIGEEVSSKRIKEILGDLGFETKTSGTSLSITPPAWRPDVKLAADIVEEVARVYGYNKIKAVVPSASIVPPARDPRLHQLRDSLVEQGYWELLHLAFTSPQQVKRFGLDESKAVAIENPIGEEVSLMRLSLLPNVLETSARQLRTAEGIVKTFEYGHVYAKNQEHAECCLVVAAKGDTALTDSPVLAAKANLQQACAAMGYAVDVRPMEQGIASWMHPGRSAEVTCKGKVIGNLFEIHPSICTACDLPGRAAAATLDWNALMVMEPSVAIVKALPAFPAVTYDETVPAKAGTRTSSLLDGLRAVDPLLESVEIVNLYQNPADISDKRLTLHFVYRSPERTLLQAESDAAHAKVLAHVKGKIG